MTKKEVVAGGLVIALVSALFVQNNNIKLVQKELVKSNHSTSRQIQRLDSGIDFQNKRSQFLTVARDSIIMKYNKRLTPDEAYCIAEFALYVCDKYQLNPILMFAVGRRESSFNSRAVSTAGAKGIYQILPLTGRMLCEALGMEYTESMLYDFKINTSLAAKYLDYLRSEYSNIDLILIGYNAGPKWANRYRANNKIELPQETQDYLIAVKKYYSEFEDQLACYLPGTTNES